MNRRNSLKTIITLPIVFGLNKIAYSKSDLTIKLGKYIESKFKGKKLVKNKKIKLYYHNNNKLLESFTLTDCILRGTVVRTTIKTNIKSVKSISLYHETPTPQLISLFKLSSSSIPEITVSIKSFKPGKLVAVVESDDGLYYNYSLIKHRFVCYQGG